MLDKIAHCNPQAVLDIGSNVGDFWSKMHPIWPNADWFLIEGNEACMPALAATHQAYQIAYLGDRERDVDFYKRKGGGTDTGNSYYRELTSFFDDDSTEVHRVHLVPLSKIVTPRFDFIKIDVQGAELDVIRGGLDIFKAAQWVMMEVAVKEYNQGAPTQEEVYTFMDSIGFLPDTILEEIVHPIERHVVQLDVLFRNASSQVSKS